MSTGPATPARVLIVRAWLEDHPTHSLRAVITTLDEHGGPEQGREAVTSIDAACDAVRAWLEHLVADGDVARPSG